jgi:hypothetical protein
MSKEIEIRDWQDGGTKITERTPCEPPVRISDGLEGRAATRWLDGEISLGKLLQIYKVGRPSGDDLAGSIWNAFHDKLRAVDAEMQQRHDTAKKQFEIELRAGKTVDATAEAAYMSAWTHAQSILRKHLGQAL